MGPTAAPSAPETVATGQTTTGPVATGFVASQPGPTASPPPPGQVAASSVGTPVTRLPAVQAQATQPPSAATGQANPLLPPLTSPLPPAGGGLTAAILGGSPAVDPADLGTTITSLAATAVGAKHASKPPPAGGRPAAAKRLVPAAVQYAPVSAPTALPVGGGAAAAGSGGIGSGAPPVAPAFTALALLALATILLARFSLDLASWRSTLLPSRLERPG